MAAPNPVQLYNVLDGLFDHLKGASTFNTLVGSRVYNALAPATSSFPYAVLHMIDSVPMHTFDADGYETRVQITLIGAKTGGPGAMLTLADALRARIRNDNEAWTTTNHEPMTGLIDIERGPFRDDDRWRYDFDVLLRGFRA